MKLLIFNLSLCTILISLITSAKCCVYSTDLVELGKLLLSDLNKIEFTDYNAIADFKSSIEFALKSSNVATLETIQEIITLTKLHKKEKHILNATEAIQDHFNTVFSLLTPYNNYNVEELTLATNKYNASYIMKISATLLRGLFEKPMNTRRIIKTLNAQPHEYHCKSTSSLHYKIIGLHNRALLNLIMGFSTILYLSKQLHGTDRSMGMSSDEMMKLLTDMYDHHTALTMKKISRTVDNVSRDIHRCDPQEHEHEKTYDRLYDLVEYYLTSERFLNENNECNAIPKNYDGVKHSSEINKYIDESLMCHGTLYQCSQVDFKHLFLYGNDQIYRRYHAFSVVNPQSPDDEILYGNIGDATFTYTKKDLNGENPSNHSDLDMNTIEDDYKKDCTIYGCYCDNHESPRTVRYFSTKIVASSVKNDRVITGLKLVVQDRVVYIKVQTGKLSGLAVVDPKSLLWKEIIPVNIAEVDENSPDATFVKLDYNKRSLYLDDLHGPEGHYLTGVKFLRANDGIRIAAKFTPYDGVNLVTNRQPRLLARSDVNRTELKLDNSSIPLHMINLNTEPMSVQNQDYIKFQPSDIKNDAGQTTIPFLDIQPVESIPPIALGGFGIYYRGKPDMLQMSLGQLRCGGALTNVDTPGPPIDINSLQNLILYFQDYVQ